MSKKDKKKSLNEEGVLNPDDTNPDDTNPKDMPKKGLFVPKRTSFTCGATVIGEGSAVTREFLEKHNLDVDKLLSRGLLEER